MKTREQQEEGGPGLPLQRSGKEATGRLHGGGPGLLGVSAVQSLVLWGPVALQLVIPLPILSSDPLQHIVGVALS